MGYLFRILRGLGLFIVAVFHLCAVFALFFGGYIGYTTPSKNPDPGERLADSAIYAASESTEIVEKIGAWFADEIFPHNELAKTRPCMARPLILVPQILIYYPAWIGAGVGGVIGGLIGDLASHVAHRVQRPASPQPAASQSSAPAAGMIQR